MKKKKFSILKIHQDELKQPNHLSIKKNKITIFLKKDFLKKGKKNEERRNLNIIKIGIKE